MHRYTPPKLDDQALQLSEAEILQSLDTSFWLREAIKTCSQRDPLDALNDAETLAQLQRQRVDDLLQHCKASLPLQP